MGVIARKTAAAIAACVLSVGVPAIAPPVYADPATLPPMTPTNAGPIIGGGGSAPGVAQQLISLANPNVQEVDGSDAAQFITAAAAAAGNPQLAASFTLLRRVMTCQTNNAGWGARAFRRNDGLWGGAMLVTAKSTTGNVDALVACVKTNWHKSTAGGEAAMCNNGWTTPTTGARNSEVYYVLLAGTAADFCVGLNGKYATNASGWP
jgi:hypothetical protein